jgi:hypothetical protein
MIGGKVFDYQIREIFGEAIASSGAVGNEVHYQRGVFANILHRDNFACFKASLVEEKAKKKEAKAKANGARYPRIGFSSPIEHASDVRTKYGLRRKVP